MKTTKKISLIEFEKLVRAVIEREKLAPLVEKFVIHFTKWSSQQVAEFYLCIYCIDNKTGSCGHASHTECIRTAIHEVKEKFAPTEYEMSAPIEEIETQPQSS